MGYTEKTLGPTATFLLPSLKLKQGGEGGQPIERRIHRFLMETFGGYTATQGNLFGYWAEDGDESYGEHRAFSVACAPGEQMEELKAFLGSTADELQEKCIYLEVGGAALLVYGDARK